VEELQNLFRFIRVRKIIAYIQDSQSASDFALEQLLEKMIELF
jgi:hypothetical protein